MCYDSLTPDCKREIAVYERLYTKVATARVEEKGTTKELKNLAPWIHKNAADPSTYRYVTGQWVSGSAIKKIHRITKITKHTGVAIVCLTASNENIKCEWRVKGKSPCECSWRLFEYGSVVDIWVNNDVHTSPSLKKMGFIRIQTHDGDDLLRVNPIEDHCFHFTGVSGEIIKECKCSQDQHRQSGPIAIWIGRKSEKDRRRYQNINGDVPTVSELYCIHNSHIIPLEDTQHTQEETEEEEMEEAESAEDEEDLEDKEVEDGDQEVAQEESEEAIAEMAEEVEEVEEEVESGEEEGGSERKDTMDDEDHEDDDDDDPDDDGNGGTAGERRFQFSNMLAVHGAAGRGNDSPCQQENDYSMGTSPSMRSFLTQPDESPKLSSTRPNGDDQGSSSSSSRFSQDPLSTKEKGNPRSLSALEEERLQNRSRRPPYEESKNQDSSMSNPTAGYQDLDNNSNVQYHDRSEGKMEELDEDMDPQPTNGCEGKGSTEEPDEEDDSPRSQEYDRLMSNVAELWDTTPDGAREIFYEAMLAMIREEGVDQNAQNLVYMLSNNYVYVPENDYEQQSIIYQAAKMYLSLSSEVPTEGGM